MTVQTCALPIYLCQLVGLLDYVNAALTADRKYPAALDIKADVAVVRVESRVCIAVYILLCDYERAHGDLSVEPAFHDVPRTAFRGASDYLPECGVRTLYMYHEFSLPLADKLLQHAVLQIQRKVKHDLPRAFADIRRECKAEIGRASCRERV